MLGIKQFLLISMLLMDLNPPWTQQSFLANGQELEQTLEEVETCLDNFRIPYQSPCDWKKEDDKLEEYVRRQNEKQATNPKFQSPFSEYKEAALLGCVRPAQCRPRRDKAVCKCRPESACAVAKTQDKSANCDPLATKFLAQQLVFLTAEEPKLRKIQEANTALRTLMTCLENHQIPKGQPCERGNDSRVIINLATKKYQTNPETSQFELSLTLEDMKQINRAMCFGSGDCKGECICAKGCSRTPNKGLTCEKEYSAAKEKVDAVLPGVFGSAIPVPGFMGTGLGVNENQEKCGATNIWPKSYWNCIDLVMSMIFTVQFYNLILGVFSN